MDRGAWWATVHGVTRVKHDLAAKQPPPSETPKFESLYFYLPHRDLYGQGVP